MRSRRIWHHGRLAPKSLRGQLLSRLLLLLAALLLLIGVAQYYWMSRFLYENKAAGLRSEALSVSPDFWLHSLRPAGSAYDPDGDGDRDRPPGLSRAGAAGGEHDFGKGRMPSLLYSGAEVAYRDSNGAWTLLSDGQDTALTSDSANGLGAAGVTGTAGADPAVLLSEETYGEALAGEANGSYRIARDAQGIRKLIVLQPIEAGGGRGLVQVAVDVQPMTDLLVRQLAIFVSIAAAALALGLLGLLPVLRRTLTPLSRLVDTLGRIDAGRLSVRVPERQGQVEIDRLSSSFNDMLRRLERAFESEREAKERMRRFVADASHELRTPMTSIHGFLEVLLRGAAGDAAQLERALVSMRGESERINKLVEDLLTLAKLDQAPSVAPERGDLAELLRGMEPQLRLLCGERSLLLQASGGCACTFAADQMKQVVLNLFQNAVQHTPSAGGRIRVAAERTEAEAVLVVEDNGPGIPPEHLPRIFDRFYRIDSSRARKAGGSGLGLAISRSIVESFGGTIEAESEAGRGALFRIRLPLA